MRAANLQCCWHLLPNSAQNRTRVARFWLVLIACLAQVWVPAQNWHARAFTSYSIAYASAPEASGSPQASFGAGQSGVRCPLHGTRASSHDRNGAPPYDGSDCPFCPCSCCAPANAAMGILPPDTTGADCAPLVSTFAATPAIIGAVARFAAHPGQPRAPPVLI